MPKSKRNKQISLTRTKKNPFEVKKRLIEEIRSCVDKYSSVYVFSVNDMRNNKLKDVREQWKHSRFFFGKNKVMGLALGRNSEEEYRSNLHQISNRLKGQCGLLFSNKSAKEVLNWFESYSESDFARSGNIAVYGVNLKEGPLPQFDHSMEPYMRQLGMPTVLQRGVVHLIKDFQVCKEGDILTPEKAKILALLGHQMAEFRITVDCYWSNDGKFALVKQQNGMEENTMQVDYQKESISETGGFNGFHNKKHVNTVSMNDDDKDGEDDMIVDDVDSDYDDENEIQSKLSIKHSSEETDMRINDEISVNEHQKHEVSNNTEDQIEVQNLNNDKVEELKIATRINCGNSNAEGNDNGKRTENYPDEDVINSNAEMDDVLHKDALENDAYEKDDSENDVDEKDTLENNADEKVILESDADEKDAVENDADKKDAIENDADEEVILESDADEKDAIENDADEEVILDSDADEKHALGNDSHKDVSESVVDVKDVPEDDADEKDASEDDADEKDASEDDADEKDASEDDADEKDASEDDADKKDSLENEPDRGHFITSKNNLDTKEEVLENDLDKNNVILESNPDKEGVDKISEMDIMHTIDEESNKNVTPKDKLPLRKRILISRSLEKESKSVTEKCTKRKQGPAESKLPDASIKKSKTSKKIVTKEVVSSPDEQSPVFRSLRNRTVKIRRKKAK